MSLPKILILLGFLLSIGIPVHAAKVQIDWTDPDRYSDIKNPVSEGYKAFRRRVFENLQAQMVELGKLLPQEHTLHLEVTDLKLAGKLRGNRFRVDPYVYPPRISFHYRLTDGQGMVLKQGEEKLTGQRSTSPRGHSAKDIAFFHEKALLVDWFNRKILENQPAGQ